MLETFSLVVLLKVHFMQLHWNMILYCHKIEAPLVPSGTIFVLSLLLSRNKELLATVNQRDSATDLVYDI